jgi:tetratricopeptide (TPR) repeat protein
MKNQTTGLSNDIRNWLQQDGFFVLYNQGRSLQKLDRNADAAVLFEQAISKSKPVDSDRIRTCYDLGMCYYHLGDFPKASVYFSDVYAKTKDQKPLHRIGYLAYCYQLIILRWIIAITQDNTRLQRQRVLIEEGLQCLHDGEKDVWRAPLLIEKAVVCEILGEYQQALDYAEESFRLAQDPHSVSWAIGYHAMFVSRYARYLGDFDRCQSVLGEGLANCSTQYTKIQVQTELIRVLSSLSSSALYSECSWDLVEQARLLARNVNALTSNRPKIEAWIEITGIFAKTGNYREMMAGLKNVRSIAIEDP